MTTLLLDFLTVEVLSTFFAAVAASAAAYSAYQNYREWEQAQQARAREARRAQHNRRLEAQSRYYRVAVADPAIDAIEDFRVDIRALFSKCVQAIRRLHDEGGSIDDIKSEKESLADRFGTRHVELMDTVASASEKWDTKLRDTIREALESIPSRVLGPALSKIVDTPYADIGWQVELNQATGRIVRILRDHDPILRDIEKRDEE